MIQKILLYHVLDLIQVICHQEVREADKCFYSDFYSAAAHLSKMLKTFTTLASSNDILLRQTLSSLSFDVVLKILFLAFDSGRYKCASLKLLRFVCNVNFNTKFYFA